MKAAATALCAVFLSASAGWATDTGRSAAPSATPASVQKLAQIRLGAPPPASPAPSAPAPAPTAPSDDIIVRTTPEQTLAALEGLGFSNGEVFEQDGGRHLKVTFDGRQMYIWHDECKADACQRITFYVNFGKQDTVDDAFLNSYNVDSVVTKMYRESEGNIALTMYSVLDGGVGPSWIKGQGTRWVRYYKRALTYKPS